MMHRRTFLGGLTLGTFALSRSAEAQPAGRIYKVGMLTVSPSVSAQTVDAFRQALRDLGWVEGQNVVIEYRWDEGRTDQLPELAADLVRAGVDVIVTSGPERIRATQRASATIPIVLAVVHEPVAFGFVASFARPGGNLTGLAFQDSELSTKRRELLKEVVPRISRVALLWDRRGGGEPALRTAEKAAGLMGLRSTVTEVRGPADFSHAFDTAKRSRAEGIIQLGSPFPECASPDQFRIWP